MIQYKRKDVYNAFKWTDDWPAFVSWVQEVVGEPIAVNDPRFPDASRNPNGSLALGTSMGLMICEKDEWVFQTSNGQLMAAGPDESFAKVFEPVEGEVAPVLSIVKDAGMETESVEMATDEGPIAVPLPKIIWPNDSYTGDLHYAFLLAGDNPRHAEEIFLLFMDKWAPNTYPTPK